MRGEGGGRGSFVVRPFLKRNVAEQAARLNPRLIRFVAPAGFGKTTQAQLLATQCDRYAYCDLYEVRTPSALAEAVVRALAQERPERAQELGREMLGAGRDERAMVETAIRAWREPAALRSVFVLDHIEAAKTTPGCRDVLDGLLANRHPSRCVILCTRTAPILRATRYAAPHEALLFTEVDLRLGHDDVQRILGEPLPESQMRLIERAALGWPIAVLLLARASHEGRLEAMVEHLERAGDAHLDEFLANEIVEDLSQVQLDALVAATLIERASVRDVAFALSIGEDQARTLSGSLPLVARGDDGEIAVHPLLRALIRQRYGVKRGEFLRKTGDAHAVAGNTVRAAELLALSGDLDRAAELLESTGGFLLDAPSFEMASVVAKIDAATAMRHPAMWSAMGLEWIYTLPNAEWLRQARAVWTQLPRDAPLTVRAGVVGLYVNAASILGLFEEADAALDEFERSLTDADRPFGNVVLTLWRTNRDVWIGVDVDLLAATRAVAQVLTVDATNALWSYNVVGRQHRTRGDRARAKVASDEALESARRARLPLVHGLVLSDRVFNAWFWGDDVAFATELAELERSVPPSLTEGFRHLIACCHGRGRTEPVGYEKLKFRCAAYLIAAASATTGDDARWCAREALAAADEAGTRFWMAIAHVASALVESNAGAKACLFDQARTIAAATDSPKLRAAVESIAHGDADRGMLSAFADRFAKANKAEAVEVRVLEMTVLRAGAIVSMPRREEELLVALALARGSLERESLSDRIWPDQTTEDARNSLKVYLSRLRRRLGASTVVAVDRECALAPHVSVDIARLESILKSRAHDPAVLSAEDRCLVLSAAMADTDAIQAHARGWDWFAPAIPRIENAIREANLLLVRNAMAHGDHAEARIHADRLFERAPSDELACEYVMRLCGLSGDRLGAMRTLKRHTDALLEEFGAAPSPHLQGLTM